MADLIKVKSGALGNRGTMPRLDKDELGYRTDEKALYIGTDAGNMRLCGVNDVEQINAQIQAILNRLGIANLSE